MRGKLFLAKSQMGWDFMDGCGVISAYAFSGMSASVLVVLSVLSLMKVSQVKLFAML